MDNPSRIMEQPFQNAVSLGAGNKPVARAAVTISGGAIAHARDAASTAGFATRRPRASPKRFVAKWKHLAPYKCIKNNRMRPALMALTMASQTSAVRSKPEINLAMTISADRMVLSGIEMSGLSRRPARWSRRTPRCHSALSGRKRHVVRAL